MYFLNRRPRGFHHTYRFSNEQRDLLNELRRGTPPETLAERSLNKAAENTNGTRRRDNTFGLSRWLIVAMLILVLAFVLVLL